MQKPISEKDSRRKTQDTIPYLSFPIFQNIQSVKIATSTRNGGCSQHPYHTLNLAYHVGDVDEMVAENRQRFLNVLGIDAGGLVIAQQVHGDKISIIGDSYAGRGAYNHKDSIPGTDGMITRTSSVALGVLTADCVPIMLMDPIRKVIGIAHAGWRGTLNMIASRTVSKMRDAFGTESADCLAALGPSIGPCCYEVGAEVLSLFLKKFGSEVCITKNKLDLKLAIKNQLTDLGVKESNIYMENLCTACNLDLFYSYRAERGTTGRMMSVIKLTGALCL